MDNKKRRASVPFIRDSKKQKFQGENMFEKQNNTTKYDPHYQQQKKIWNELIPAKQLADGIGNILKINKEKK